MYCSENEVINMLEFLIDNIFAEFGGTFCSKSSVSLEEQSVPLSSHIFSIIHALSRKKKSATERMKSPVCWSLIDNIFVEFGGHIFQQIITYGNKLCPSPCRSFPMLIEFMQKLIKDKIILKLKPLISLSGILTKFCQLIIHWIPLIYPTKILR